MKKLLTYLLIYLLTYLLTFIFIRFSYFPSLFLFSPPPSPPLLFLLSFLRVLVFVFLLFLIPILLLFTSSLFSCSFCSFLASFVHSYSFIGTKVDKTLLCNRAEIKKRRQQDYKVNVINVNNKILELEQLTE